MKWRGWLILLGCLVVVGLIRAVVPTDIPFEYNVRPDDQGRVRMDEVSVQLLKVQTASAVRSAVEFSEASYAATPGAVLVVAQFHIEAHGGQFAARSQLRTADGFTYGALDLYGFPSPQPVHVGLGVSTTYIFEVPEDKVSGVIGIHGTRPDGLQPIAPLIVYGLPDDLDPNPGEVSVAEAVVEPTQ